MARRHGSMGVFFQALLVGVVSGILFLAALVLMTLPDRRASREPGDSNPYAALHTETPEDTAIQTALFDANSRAVPILCHHYFRANTTPLQFVKILGALFLNLPLLDDMDVWTQTAASFENQLSYLASEGYASISLEDLVLWQMGAKEIPPKTVVITIDDADRSVLDHAYPLLERHGFKATLFIVTSQVGRRWEGVDCLTWEELKRLSDTGVFSIESHSHDLHRKVSTPEGRLPVFVAASLGVLDPAGYESWAQFVVDDLRESRALIREHVGTEARFLAWPYGFANAPLDSLAVLAGFTSTCTLRLGMNRRFLADGGHDANGAAAREGRAAWPRYELRRMTVTARTSMNGYRKMLTDDGNIPPAVP
jgi:peptidoglycan/xylan/chitin deacetylase (PgdA/CDA1 family)